MKSAFEKDLGNGKNPTAILLYAEGQWHQESTHQGQVHWQVEFDGQACT